MLILSIHNILGVVMRRLYILLLLLALPLQAHTPSRKTAVTSSQIESITATELRMHLSFLASQELGGRYTFSSGNQIAARYIASQLEAMGFRGAARDGSFFQKIEFQTVKVDRALSRITLEGSREFLYGSDFYSPDPNDCDLRGEMVFAADEKLDLQGRIAVATTRQNLETLRERGAVAVLLLPETRSSISWELVASASEAERRMQRLQRREAPVYFLNPRAATAVLRDLGIDFHALLEDISRQLPLPKAERSASVNIRVVTRRTSTISQNVVGVLDGHDPRLKAEYLLVSAHYDHLETVGGQIFPGADDDASGVSAVLAIARAFTHTRPKRSVVAMFHTGEEIGLYGSRYFTEIDPLVPLNSIVACLNIDMIGRSRASEAESELTDANSVYVIGSDKHSSSLHRLSIETNKQLYRLGFDYRYNDESHPSRLFYRSDHYNYARKGIPVIFFFTGLHKDYHRPSDTIEKIDFNKMTRIARTVFAIGWNVANAYARPKVDLWIPE